MNKSILAAEDLPLACLQLFREVDAPMLVPDDVADAYDDAIPADARAALEQLEREGVAASSTVGETQQRVWWLEANNKTDDIDRARELRANIRPEEEQ
jgi:hypothetical protein